MHAVMIFVLATQAAVAFSSAYFGAPTFSWFVNNYTGSMFPSFLFHIIYSEMVDFVIVTVYLLYYLPAMEDNISKVPVEKDQLLENYIQRRKDQIRRASMRPSKIKTGGYVTTEDDDFVVVNKENQSQGLFQY